MCKPVNHAFLYSQKCIKPTKNSGKSCFHSHKYSSLGLHINASTMCKQGQNV